ncbi:unnamed protein product [Gongylonema pulchrum]|uniref:BetaPIX_CC domain-containing protein n=1 Tax=Gongylonema pulchrum TaxID=637853 RepID=A0A183D7U8_9BILA|nr:unnamed protein product [Gongylonema pulchrum]
MQNFSLQGNQEDAFLLRIVEGYCSTSNPAKRIPAGSGMQTSVSREYDPPQLIVAENEKMFVEEVIGDKVVVKERSLVDTVYALKDQLTDLQKELRQLNKTVDREQKARRRLEELVRRMYHNQQQQQQQQQQQHQQQLSTSITGKLTPREPVNAESSTLH